MEYLLFIYVAGMIFAYKGVKKRLTNNGADMWTYGQMYFGFIYSLLSWLGALAMSDWFQEWGDGQNKESKL